MKASVDKHGGLPMWLNAVVPIHHDRGICPTMLLSSQHDAYSYHLFTKLYKLMSKVHEVEIFEFYSIDFSMQKRANL